jgi:hypothetical protein
MKNIVCSIIDHPPTDWGIWRRVIDREKYVNFDKSNFPDNAYFCNSVLENLDNKFEKIEIIGRIGSQSAEAEVYRIKFQDMDFAMKLMPRIDNDSERKNINEIETAKEASQYYEYFPLTFAYGYCLNSSYYISANNEFSSFIPKALEYSALTKLLDKTSNKNAKKRLESDYRNGKNIEDIEKIKMENKGIQVDFLISELANGDLGTWTKSKHQIDEWVSILIDIFTGIYYLTVVLMKVHADLHLGNILIVRKKKEEKGLKALIHDFGRCYPVDVKVPETTKATILSFCSEFISCSTRDDLNIPRKVLLSIQDIYKIIKNKDVNLTNIESIYKEIIYPIIEQI